MRSFFAQYNDSFDVKRLIMVLLGFSLFGEGYEKV